MLSRTALHLSLSALEERQGLLSMPCRRLGWRISSFAIGPHRVRLRSSNTSTAKRRRQDTGEDKSDFPKRRSIPVILDYLANWISAADDRAYPHIRTRAPHRRTLRCRISGLRVQQWCMRRGTAFLIRQFRGSLANGPSSSHTNSGVRLCWIGVDGLEVCRSRDLRSLSCFWAEESDARRYITGAEVGPYI